ncbi:hypothetical protein AAKU61_004623 [Undibacterium sp. GrIS 1.2]
MSFALLCGGYKYWHLEENASSHRRCQLFSSKKLLDIINDRLSYGVLEARFAPLERNQSVTFL